MINVQLNTRKKKDLENPIFHLLQTVKKKRPNNVLTLCYQNNKNRKGGSKWMRTPAIINNQSTFSVTG